ncbi:MAG: tetratricopeptide repeat protein [Slackia sp.]|nr:tetratricopeptide repeat protein [Slackia sp.]
MDNQSIAQARAAYQARDFQTALDLFSQCLVDPAVVKGPGDLGYIYHQIGNCFLQLKDFNQAIHAYTQATADAAYDACGAVNCNLAKAYAFLHDYENAVSHFEIAVSDAKYDASYKAYLGLGNALLKLGKNAEAGVAFREAALDVNNPDRTKALLNLGVCFMALGRPADAVQSYESALQFDMDPATRNKMYANLGQAYVACGQMQQAMSAFETALADKTYFLSDSASVDYGRAAQAVATGTAAMQPIVAAPAEPENDMSGLDVAADGAPLPQDSSFDQATQAFEPYNDPQYYPVEAYGYTVPDGYASGDERFFNASDEELERYSKGIAKQDRKRRNVGLKILVVFFTLLLLAAAGCVFLYTQGYGYPTQESVAKSLFSDTANASQYFAESMGEDNIEAAMRGVVQDSNVTIDGVDKTMSNSTVYVSAKTAEGGDVDYKVQMVRDLLGWKVSGIEMSFPSQQ